MYTLKFKDLTEDDIVYYIKTDNIYESNEEDITCTEIVRMVRGRKSTVLRLKDFVPRTYSFLPPCEFRVYNRASVAYFHGIIMSADPFELGRLIKKNKGI